MSGACKVDVYTLIANHWDIPRHRVKLLITAGAYGMAGSEKSVEEWVKQLDAWDEAEAERLLQVTKEAAVAGAEQGKKKGRFKSNIRNILGLK
jgi:hypothetical protein